MIKSGPIIIIEDSKAEQRLLIEVFKDLSFDNDLCFFTDGNDALSFLNTTTKIPFLIISDINMPRLNGFELRNKIQENEALSLKCVPFLFFSSGENEKSVSDAYSMSVQGFFKKPMGVKELENTMRKIIEYWKECIAPNDYHS